MKATVILLAMLAFSSESPANTLTQQTFKMGSLEVSYTVVNPSGEPIADVLYLHGYGDTYLNHRPLFEKWAEYGLRVLAFDYPSHGSTTGAYSDDLTFHTFADLAHIAAKVLNENAPEFARPLILAGWSTGGLLASRIAQVPSLRNLFPNLSGLILFAPGVSVHKCPGNHLCHITNKTLTHSPELQTRVVRPASPLYRLKFATRLLQNSFLSWRQPIPYDIPMLVFVAGEKQDSYVRTKRVKQWVQNQRRHFSSAATGVECPSARHELDNEPIEFGGDIVREQSAIFASQLANKTYIDLELNPQAPCHLF